MWQFWLIAAGIFFVIEIFTVGFFIFWLAIASLLAMVVSLFTDNIFIQSAIFVISSALLILFTRPFVNKFANIQKTNTNVYSLINKVGIVTQDINPIEATGQVKINGDLWSADTTENKIISAGSKIKVLAIKGVKLVVESIN